MFSNYFVIKAHWFGAGHVTTKQTYRVPKPTSPVLATVAPTDLPIIKQGARAYRSGAGCGYPLTDFPIILLQFPMPKPTSPVLATVAPTDLPIIKQGARAYRSGAGCGYPLTDFPIILLPIPVLVMFDKTNIHRVP